jgi:hypothetical protein
VIVSYQKENTKSENNVYVIILCFGILYPWIYDLTQLIRGGLADYLSDPWNYADMLYIYGSIVNCILQFWGGPFHVANRIMMCIICILLIVKTFFFLRIFPSLTPLVVMLTQVIGDLKAFMTFYAILIVMFSQFFCVLGIANYKNPNTEFGKSYGDIVKKS